MRCGRLTIVILTVFLTLTFAVFCVQAATFLVDSYSDTNRDNTRSIAAVHPSSSSYTSAASQSFTMLPTDKNLTVATFYVKLFVGSPGFLVARLYSHIGTYGTDSLPNTLLATSTGVDASLLSTSYTLVNFSFPEAEQYAMVADAKYVIAVEAYNGTWDGGNYVVVGYDSSSPSHSGNMARYASSGWGSVAGDVCFSVYGDVTPCWNLVETWNLNVQSNATGWNSVETWNLSVQTTGWHAVETWTLNVEAEANWHAVETWSFSIASAKEWHSVETWSLSVQSNATGWHTVEVWTLNVTAVGGWRNVERWNLNIFAGGTGWHTVETWNFSIFSPSPVLWHDVEYWNFTLNSTLTWRTVETWSLNVTAYTPANWHDAEYWNLTLNGTSGWSSVETWNFSMSTNVVGWHTVESWNFSMFSFHQGFAWPAHFPFWLKAYNTYVDFNDWAYFDDWNWNPFYITYVTFTNIQMGVGLPVPSLYVSVLNGNVSFNSIDYLHVVSFDMYGTLGSTPQLILQGLGTQAAYMTVDGTLYPVGSGWLYDAGTDTTTVQFTFNTTGYYSVVLSWGIAPSAWNMVEQWNLNFAASAGPGGIIIVTNTTSYYLRSDTVTVNNSTAYYMNAANSATATTIILSHVDSGLSGSIGYRVYILHSDGSTSELTSGVPEAVGTLNVDNASIVNSNWNCPGSGLSVGWDAIRVDVYLRAGLGAWSLKGSWATDTLLDNAVLASGWVFNAYLNKTSTAGTTVSFTFGSGTQPCILSGVLLNPATEFELMLYNLGAGNMFTFIMAPFTNRVGPLIYGMVLLLILVPVYIKHRDIDIILLMMIMFGGAGGFFWAMIPASGLWIGFVVMAFALAALIYRVWPH